MRISMFINLEDPHGHMPKLKGKAAEVKALIPALAEGDALDGTGGHTQAYHCSVYGGTAWAMGSTITDFNIVELEVQRNKTSLYILASPCSSQQLRGWIQCLWI